MPITNEAAVEILRVDADWYECAAKTFAERATASVQTDEIDSAALLRDSKLHERHAEALRAAIAALERKPVAIIHREELHGEFPLRYPLNVSVTLYAPVHHDYGDYTLYANPSEPT